MTIVEFEFAQNMLIRAHEHLEETCEYTGAHDVLICAMNELRRQWVTEKPFEYLEA